MKNKTTISASRDYILAENLLWSKPLSFPSSAEELESNPLFRGKVTAIAEGLGYKWYTKDIDNRGSERPGVNFRAIQHLTNGNNIDAHTTIK